MFSKRPFFLASNTFQFLILRVSVRWKKLISLKKYLKKFGIGGPVPQHCRCGARKPQKRQKIKMENAMVNVTVKRNTAKTIHDCRKFYATKCLLQCSFWDLKIYICKGGQKTLNGGKTGGFQYLYIKMLVHCSSYMHLFCARPLTSWLLISLQQTCGKKVHFFTIQHRNKDVHCKNCMSWVLFTCKHWSVISGPYTFMYKPSYFYI